MSSTDPSISSQGMWEPPSAEALQAMLPQYEISAIIGRGGMGAVYRGRQAKLDRDVAIKLLPETLAEGADEMNFVARFEQEAKAMAKLDHPAIISVHDFGETSEGQLYIVMEFVEGMDIHQYLQYHGGKLIQEDAIAIIAHVLDALDYAHAHGIVHRDIKPANVLLNHEGRVKIADFGLAKTLSSGEDEAESDQPALTMSNVAVGTPDFVAPEALDSDQVPDHRADLYAVGVMLYQMLTGSLPRGQFKLPSEQNPELDPRLDEIVDQALQANPADRYASASEVRLALEPIFTTPITKLEGEEKKTVKPWLKVAVVAVATAGVIGGLVMAVTGGGGDEGRPTGYGEGGEAGLAAVGEGEEEAEVPELSQRHEAYVKEWNKKFGALTKQYLSALESQYNAAADAGNLNLVTAFEAEKEQAESFQQAMAKAGGRLHGGVLDPLSVDTPEGLVKLRNIWNTEGDKIQKSLNGALDMSLATLQTELTKGRKLDAARAVKTYRDKITGAMNAGLLYPVPSPGGGASEPSAVAPAVVATGGGSGSDVATKEKPFVNNLGMKFVPVPITGGPTDGQRVLFSVWETRVADYRAFVEETGREWEELGVKNEETHPAIMVSWLDSEEFCRWLTTKEREKGAIGVDEAYRLPSDHEWSCAAEIGRIEDPEISPLEKDLAIQSFIWGDTWPPPFGIGNLCGEESGGLLKGGTGVISGFDDKLMGVSPVGSFRSDNNGIHDLVGNVWEWCADWKDPTSKEKRVLRGASWRESDKRSFYASRRMGYAEDYKSKSYGFRAVLAPTSVGSREGAKAATPETATKTTPFVNTLGMKFVPVPITGGPTDGKRVLFSIWETRVQDYEAFVEANPVVPPWNYGRSKAVDAHPAAWMTWEEAKSFCEWLTETERDRGTITSEQRYRLPSDHEWSCAVGIGDRENAKASPESKDGKLRDLYPWGSSWPPPSSYGNFSGSENAEGKLEESSSSIPGWRDPYKSFAPVGSHTPNSLGLHEMAGNCMEWVGSRIKENENSKPVIRGGAWRISNPEELLSSKRTVPSGKGRNSSLGFRVVLAED